MKVLQLHNQLLILLDDEAIERIKRYDPAEIQMKDYGLGDVLIGISYANAEDMEVIIGHLRNRNSRLAFAHATRGFEYKPEAGDHDMGPVSILNPPKADA